MPTGPLDGIRVTELGGIGPGPFAGMLLADLGADVIRVDRVGTPADRPRDVLLRGRRSVLLDLKRPAGQEALGRLLASSHVLIEGFRPGVIERLGFSPEECWQRCPELVIGRVTGWGQDGPLAQAVGHDINYVGLSGALHAIGAKDGPPTIPLNLIGDNAGGGMLLAFGILCALWETQRSGRGQVVDAAMVDGAALLMAKWFGEYTQGRWQDQRGSNRVDGGSHYYHVYETADGQYLAVGAIEGPFYRRMLELFGFEPDAIPQHDADAWPDLTAVLAGRVRERTRAEWESIFDGEDACVTPILGLSEAPSDAHLAKRATFVEIDGIVQPAPAPRFQRTPGRARSICPPGVHTDEVLAEAGYSPTDIAAMRAEGAAA